MKQKSKKADKAYKGRAGPADIELGNRLRVARIINGISQSQVGEYIGVSFQQIQKNEKGSNRVAASKIPGFCKLYDRSYAFFLDDLDEPLPANKIQFFKDNKGASFSEEMVAFVEKYSKLIKIFEKFPDIEAQKNALRILERMAALYDKTEGERAA